MNNKYEQLVEFIINDETDKARALFHEIVVEKSRDIYESLVEEEDLDETMGGNEVEDLVDEVSLDEEGISEEEEEEEFGNEEFGSEEEDGDESVEDRVLDLEDALDELKAEFDALMAGEEAEEAEHPGIHDFGGEDTEEYGNEDEMEGVYESAEEDDEEEEEEEEDLEESIVREYVETVGTPYQGELDGKEGKLAGTGARSIKGTPNTKNPVAGKNPLGAGSASARNIATGKANSNPDGTTPAKEGAANEYKKGEGKLPHNGQFKNVPGTKKVWDQKGPTDGHGAEKVGEKEGKLAGNDGRRPVNTKSTLKPRA